MRSYMMDREAFAKGRREGDWKWINEARELLIEQDHVTALKDEALRGLSSHYWAGRRCFCEVRIDNPNMKGRHSGACEKAWMALTA